MTTRPLDSLADDQRPARLVIRPSDGTAPEDRAAKLLRAGDWSPVLEPAARARIFEGVRARQRARGPGLTGLRWALAAVVLFTSGGVIAAAVTGRWPQFLSRPRTVDSAATLAPAKVARPPQRSPQDAPAPAEAPLAVATPPPALQPPPAPPPSKQVGKTHSSLSDESQLLGRAMAHLRQQGDAAAAIDDLDQYQARFPRGTLKREATIARVDALLMLKRDQTALPLLTQLDLQAHGRDQELRVIRGELSARASCARAIADFDRVLSESPPPDLIERALYGRAGCRLQQGDARAADDLAQYLRQFPHGRFAAEARRALSSGR